MLYVVVIEMITAVRREKIQEEESTRLNHTPDDCYFFRGNVNTNPIGLILFEVWIHITGQVAIGVHGG